MPISKRSFLSGSWDRSQESAEIVSLVVSAKPGHLAGVADTIARMPGAEIHARDKSGKLIVVLEAPTQGEIGAMANEISGIPHVLSAVMAFQATDTPETV